MTLLAKFATTCPKCRNRIELGTVIDWNPIDKKATHKTCPPKKAALGGVPGLDLTPIPSGNYAAVMELDALGAPLRYELIAVRHGRTPGFTWVRKAFKSRWNEEAAYGKSTPTTGYVGAMVAELKVILADPQGAGIWFGRLSGCCCICNKPLTDPKSIAAGIGPVCVKRFARRAA